MAVPDRLKTTSRSADRLSENQPRHANDPAAGPTAQVLSLQRTIGNRATTQLLRSWHPAGGVLQRALRGRTGVVSARPPGHLNVVTGSQILEQFSRNDQASLGNLVGNLPYRPDPLDAQEWGLISEKATGEVHLILGVGGQVNWDPYLDEGTPLAHSHPFRPKEEKPMGRIGSISIGDLVPDPAPAGVQPGGPLTPAQELAPQARRIAGNIILPTVSDFVAPAEQGQRDHTVFTPYEVDAQGNVSNPQGAGVPRLVWEITEILLDRTSPDKSQHRVRGRLTAKAGGTPFWTRIVQAPATRDVEDLRGTWYSVIGR
jgi:hypothetical protein